MRSGQHWRQRTDPAFISMSLDNRSKTGRGWPMKYQGCLVLIALFAAGQACAQELSVGASRSLVAPTKGSKIHWFTSAPAPDARYDLSPAEGLSREAWTTTVGWHPGVSAFPDAETYGSRMCFLWIGHEPWRHMTHAVDEQ